VAILVNPTAGSDRDNSRRLNSISDELAMANGEPCTTVNANTVFRTTLEQTERMEMKYEISQTQRRANLGRGTRRGDGPMAVPWPA